MAAGSSRLTISEAKPWHCGQIARRMRRAHLDALGRTGTSPHAELRAIFGASAFRRVAHRDGVLLALGGVASTIASDIGYVWLALTEDAIAYPYLLAREARRQMEAIMRTHSELATTVLIDDRAAARFALHLGFHTGHDDPKRKVMVTRLIEMQSLHIPVGRTAVVPLGYHERA